MRTKANRKRDKSIFRRTAQSTAAANLNGSSYRGGIRL